MVVKVAMWLDRTRQCSFQEATYLSKGEGDGLVVERVQQWQLVFRKIHVVGG